MPQIRLLLPFWILWFSFSSSVSHARMSSWMAPIAGPVLSPTMGPVSPTSTSRAAVPYGNQIVAENPHHHLHRGLLLAIIVVSVISGLILFASFCILIYRRNSSQHTGFKGVQSSEVSKSINLGPLLGKLGSLKTTGRKGSISVIEYSLLEVATNHFNENNILGEGGFSCVYKAQLADNVYAAVKKIEGDGPESEKEFENEMGFMSIIQHPNIVSLLGYCVCGKSRFLISELMQNGSLDIQLHGPSNGSALAWHRRMKIALDTARGLEYLHEHCNPPIIHRDLKSSNILLDSNFNAKLSDFGLAVTVGSQSKSNINLSGTIGYIAPEYLLDGKLTEKSDVYAFGVVLLELLMGRKPIEKMTPGQCQSIITWAMPQLTDRSKLPNIVDPVIKDTMNLKHLYQVAAVAVLCVQPEPSYRPLITDVLHSLIPLVPVELGGTLRDVAPRAGPKSAQ
ncbi:probable receptor-like protein kinase At1g80640 [Aristolochia californica]|uniref:probable receptor-like protein kinase At1g80640 n=1 Tax=Aristolochia californica TaxID=171875 RepID=UPI0035D923FF